MEHSAVMDVTELKENGAALERLGPRDPLVRTERRERREILELWTPPVKKDSEGRKVREEPCYDVDI